MDGGSRPDAASGRRRKIVDATKEAFDFLGYRFERGQRFPRPKSLQKLKDTIRAKTKRTSGESLTKIINDLTPTLRGWFEYFKQSPLWVALSQNRPLQAVAGGQFPSGRVQSWA